MSRFSAAVTPDLARHGMLLAAEKNVLLIDRRAALLAESGWSFQPVAGDALGSEWQQWLRELQTCGGAADEHIDGAIAEVTANEWVRRERQNGRLGVLYYASPIAVDNHDLLQSILVGTKGGVRRIHARQWIDATDAGELLALYAAVQNREWQVPPRLTRESHLYFRYADGVPSANAALPSLDDATLQWQGSRWSNERCLTISGIDAATSVLRTGWPDVLQSVRSAMPKLFDGAVLTHASTEPFDVFAPVPEVLSLPQNVAAASPWLRSDCADSLLAGRFAVGVTAAQRVLESAVSSPDVDAPFQGEVRWQELETEIGVAGAGTGGALAALSAARQGAQVLAFDPLPFCGGIGAGGGIHWYYFGVKGGLQDEMDERLRAVMPLFAPTGQIMGFHPDAKKCVLEAMLRESGVNLMFGATLLDVERDGNRVQSALLSTPGGPVRLKAGAWVDGTGDGDLAARAGAGVRFGRDGDGLLHAYSQSSGRAGIQDEKVRMNVVNYDAGFVDPTDSEDLTRARLEGISHYVQAQYSEIERPTYIAPAIGLRQSRHIVTDYTLELADLIERREFSDSVGLTGCHYDNHANDYEFESDEAMFWVWVCGQWRGKTGCEIPYRILLPQGLDNVWLACRALGVSQDAHHSLRMQRDMQRIGEVSGIAAALSRQTHGKSRAVDFELLRATLETSGALERRNDETDTFGPDTKGSEVVSHRRMMSHRGLPNCKVERMAARCGIFIAREKAPTCANKLWPCWTTKTASLLGARRPSPPCGTKWLRKRGFCGRLRIATKMHQLAPVNVSCRTG
jgi:hypothetical protein